MGWDHHYFRFVFTKKIKSMIKKNVYCLVLFEALERMLLVKASDSGEKTDLFASNDASPP